MSTKLLRGMFPYVEAKHMLALSLGVCMYVCSYASAHTTCDNTIQAALIKICIICYASFSNDHGPLNRTFSSRPQSHSYILLGRSLESITSCCCLGMGSLAKLPGFKTFHIHSVSKPTPTKHVLIPDPLLYLHSFKILQLFRSIIPLP